MALITEKAVAAFDLTQIKRGDLFWGKHNTWNEGKAGFVTSVTEDLLIVQYHPGIGNVTNHFMIPIKEAVDRQWEIRWSNDLADVQEYNIIIDDEQQENEEEIENDTGGIDT